MLTPLAMGGHRLFPRRWIWTGQEGGDTRTMTVTVQLGPRGAGMAGRGVQGVEPRFLSLLAAQRPGAGNPSEPGTGWALGAAQGWAAAQELREAGRAAVCTEQRWDPVQLPG